MPQANERVVGDRLNTLRQREADLRRQIALEVDREKRRKEKARRRNSLAIGALVYDKGQADAEFRGTAVELIKRCFAGDSEGERDFLTAIGW